MGSAWLTHRAPFQKSVIDGSVVMRTASVVSASWRWRPNAYATIRARSPTYPIG
jgi:hypothetical protein